MLLSTAPVLAAPQLDQPFQLEVDASHVGAGAVLLQTDDQEVDRPVSFFLKKFDSPIELLDYRERGIGSGMGSKAL